MQSIKLSPTASWVTRVGFAEKRENVNKIRMIEFPCGRAKDKRSVTKTIFMVICDVIATLFECSAHARHLNILQFFHIFSPSFGLLFVTWWMFMCAMQERLESGVVSLVPDELPDYVNDNPIIEMDEGERRIEMDDSGPVPVCPPAVSIINCHHSSDLLKHFPATFFF